MQFASTTNRRLGFDDFQTSPQKRVEKDTVGGIATGSSRHREFRDGHTSRDQQRPNNLGKNESFVTSLMPPIQVPPKTSHHLAHPLLSRAIILVRLRREKRRIHLVMLVNTSIEESPLNQGENIRHRHEKFHPEIAGNHQAVLFKIN